MSNPWEATKLFAKMLSEYTDNGHRQGVYEERERIIALLEAEETVHETGKGELRDIIALIKGENE